MPRLIVIKPGMLTTVQARPRVGWQHVGVPPGGPMDEYSFRLANLIVGNDGYEAALEMTLLGAEIVFDNAAVIAICGADLRPEVDGADVPLATAVTVRAGARVRFGGRRAGTRAYLAVRGGLDAPLVLGSRATSLSGALPGLAGRSLRAGDQLTIGEREVRPPRSIRPDVTLPLPDGVARVRFVSGPDAEMFPRESLEAFEGAEYRVTPQSNRMGYRLEGPRLFAANAGTLLSEATPIGSIQVPPSGLPIVLMADRQTTGGYPRIGTVITTDLPVAGQLGPGDPLSFVRCSVENAISSLRARERALDSIGSVS